MSRVIMVSRKGRSGERLDAREGGVNPDGCPGMRSGCSVISVKMGWTNLPAGNPHDRLPSDTSDKTDFRFMAELVGSLVAFCAGSS